MITPKDQQPIRSSNDTVEFRRNYNATEFVNALYAIDNGWTGKGVAVGVIDNGARGTAAEDLNGAIDPRSRDFGQVITGGVRADRNVIGDENSNHGNSVSQIIAGRRNDLGAMGYAPEANIVVLRVDDYNADTKVQTYVWDVRALDYATEIGLKVVNRSLGSTGPRTDLQAAVQKFGAQGGLLINSAGNNEGTNPEDAVNVTSANRSAWLFVVALDPAFEERYTIAEYSNHCGTMMDICVTAPGTNIVTRPGSPFAGGIAPFGGTSSAAPVATALAATILQKWPQLTGQQAGEIILNTARDIGKPGVDPVFGRGLIDFRAALSPVNPTLNNGSQSLSIDNAVMVVGNAFGGTAKGAECVNCDTSISTALSNITVLDAYGRDFNGSFASMVVRPDNAAASGHWLRRRMEAQASAGTAGWLGPGSSATLGFASLPTIHRNADGSEVRTTMLTNANFRMNIGGNTSVVAGFNSTDDVQRDIMGLAPTSDAMFAYSPLAQTNIGLNHKIGKGSLAVMAYAGNQADTRTIGTVVRWQSKAGTLKVGVLDETGAVFGTPVGAGALRFGDGATTLFTEVASGFDAGAWSFDGYASLGATRLKVGSDMLITDADTFTSARFGFNVGRQVFRGRATLGLAQELVALNAQATYTVGNGYDLANRSLTFGQRQVDFSGEISPRLTFGYEQQGERSALRLGTSADGAARDVRAVGTWTIRW
ncbi:S8 family serine peptidase [Erythrobacter sp. R86502]|uniref:S8 family serine peptidase n=1 Tax=Erythrobacter sp. R86502 TaxID=3093846 RepID=UPI0036D29C14